MKKAIADDPEVTKFINIYVTKGGYQTSLWMWLNKTKTWDVVGTGCGPWKDKEFAILEATEWAVREECPIRDEETI